MGIRPLGGDGGPHLSHGFCGPQKGGVGLSGGPEKALSSRIRAVSVSLTLFQNLLLNVMRHLVAVARGGLREESLKQPAPHPQAPWPRGQSPKPGMTAQKVQREGAAVACPPEPPWATGRPRAPHPALPHAEPMGLCRPRASGSRGPGAALTPCPWASFGQETQIGPRGTAGQALLILLPFFEARIEGEAKWRLAERSRVGAASAEFGWKRGGRGAGRWQVRGFARSPHYFASESASLVLSLFSKSQTQAMSLIAPTAAHRWEDNTDGTSSLHTLFPIYMQMVTFHPGCLKEAFP